MRRALLACLPCLYLMGGCQPKLGPPQASPSPPATATPTAESNALYNQGKHLFDQTYERMPQVKARLHCSSCHLQGGTAAGAASLVGIASDFPSYSARAGREISLAERVNECMERSMNGPALAPDSQEMKAFLAYIEGLKSASAAARGISPLAAATTKPDGQRGQALYKTHCQDCHQADGSGTYNGQAYLYPALWGERSFNIGADLAQPDKLASFIFVKMPLGRGATLTPQETWDVATYISQQARRGYPKASQDFPKGGAPADLPYKLGPAQ